ncbi:hypothetical protein F183_A18560 [Bryobacterales bacterium F-183]|nr:hypothetical protein F183_A18560 [Bryobacterales bacterium F-183]
MRFFLLGVLGALAVQAASGPEYTADGAVRFPEDYREWVYLSSGLGMTYGPAATSSGPPQFDSVFVNPAAWAEFKKTGKWPNGTMFILEIRKSVSEGSINRGGHFQGEVVGIEASVKDTTRFPGAGWAYLTFRTGAGKQTKVLSTKASCYGCHSANGAVDYTFVQFYPTAMPIAREKGTFRP